MNATTTLVRFEGQIYLVACRHVKAAFSRSGWAAWLQGGSTIISLDDWSRAALVPALHHVDIPEVAEIRVCPLPIHLVDFLAHHRPIAPVDLDKYVAPRWEQTRYFLAAGFPDRPSPDAEAVIALPIVEAVAELGSALGPTRRTFTLQSALDEPSSYGFSGMLGGPIFALEPDNAPLPCGIILEVFSSGEEPLGTGRLSDAFLCDRDILIRGHLLTPDTFGRWLRYAGLKSLSTTL